MTATHVNGAAVIADEPTRSRITANNGTPIYWQQIRTLLLEDGTETYGCLHCDYTADNPNRVRPHLAKHRHLKPEGKVKTTRTRPQDMSLTDLLARVADMEKVTTERDEWKRRALKAERALTTMRKALNS